MARNNQGINVLSNLDPVPTDLQGGYAGGDSTAAAIAQVGGAATTAQTTAATAASKATDALTTVNNLGVAVQILPPGSTPSGSVTGGVGTKVINLGIPSGSKLRVANGTPISLDSTVPTGTLNGFRVTTATSIEGVTLTPGVYIWERTTAGWEYYAISTGTPVTVKTPPIVIPGGISDTFSGDSGVAPTGWTERWATTSGTPIELADGYLQITRTAAARYALTPDALATLTGDCDAVIKVRWPANAPKSAFGYGLLLGGSGASGAETGLYAYVNSNTTDSIITLGKYAAGASTPLGTASAVSAFGPAGTTDTPGPWGYLRLNVTGTTARARAWAVGATEPTTWGVTATAPTINGWGGIFGSTAVTGHVDYVAIVAGVGAVAPLG